MMYPFYCPAIRRSLSGLAALIFTSACCIPAASAELRGEIVHAATGKPVAARLYIQRDDGSWHFAKSAEKTGAAIRYDKTNWVNAKSFEKHTTLSAHPFVAELPAGKYTVTVERGKEYFTETKSVDVTDAGATIRVPLRRWSNMAERAWYSGETHIHRSLDELPTLMLAENLNVTFPLTYWVSRLGTPPVSGNHNMPGNIPDRLIRVDDTHVYWPRNTEYEINLVGGRQHMLGAVFMLGHKTPLTLGAPPIGPAAEQARREGAMFDVDKPDWPWSMAMIPAAGINLYELTNNHVWRTEFAFTKFNSEMPAWILLPRGGSTGDERQWILLTLNHYYLLLNCGFKLVPSAGTASGVHPVPPGFGRVYVHIPDGFSYEKWCEGLRSGRSFVTTGPMLMVQANGQEAGGSLVEPQRTQRAQSGQNNKALVVKFAGTVTSAHPLVMIEVIQNGEIVRTVFPKNDRTAAGAFETAFKIDVPCTTSGWLAVRCFEDAPGGRLRFGHTGSWRVEMPDRPLRAQRREVEYLMRRVREQIVRSNKILPAEAIAEYEKSLTTYEAIKPRDDDSDQIRSTAGDEQQYWLRNMIVDHHFGPDEVRAVTGLDGKALSDAMEEYRSVKRKASEKDEPLRVLPYPGGRHPRIGFHDGALTPQRETKVSIFTPWDPASYIVVDVPEAVFSNLGLIYLAHTHVPTIWDSRSVKLPPQEWKRNADGSLESERELPNKIAFGAKVTSRADRVDFELWLRNGTREKLTDMRVQNCVMLKGVTGFNAQTNANKVIRGAYVAVRNDDGQRWIITAWDPLHRPWANAPVPCLHSDPKFPDAAPGETVRARGAVWFYEGKEIDAELKRLESSGWKAKH